MSSPYRHLLEELCAQFPNAWILECGWRMVGFGYSKLWLRIDESRVHGVSKGPPTWYDVCIDIKQVVGREHHHVAVLSGFESAEHAASLVRQRSDEFARAEM